MWGRLTAAQVPVIVPHWAFAEALRAALEVPAGNVPPAHMPGTSSHQVHWLPCLLWCMPFLYTSMGSLVLSTCVILALTVQPA